MAEILDDLLGLPVTPGAVDVLEGRQYVPGDVFVEVIFLAPHRQSSLIDGEIQGAIIIDSTH